MIKQEELIDLLDKWKDNVQVLKNWSANTAEPSARKIYGAKQYQLETCIIDLEKLLRAH